MRKSFDEARGLAQELPEDQQLKLVNPLMEYPDEKESPSEAERAAWDEEIACRVAGIKAGTAAACSLEEFALDLRSIADR